VRKYNGVPPFAETRRYIQDVKRYYSVTSRD
jgi:soluble lytic murein transglycosylase-like protein